MKRAPDLKVFPNKWTVPGGGLEAGDYINTKKTTEDAWYGVLDRVLRREVKDEVNLEIGDPVLLEDMVFIRPDNIPVLVLSYYAPYVSGDVVLEEKEAVEYKWVTVEEAREHDFISGIYEEIEMADRILKGEKNVTINL